MNMLSKRVDFSGALPVWAKGRSGEMNLSLVFTLRADFHEDKKYELVLTASSVYMAFCGDRMLSVGPARCGHGYYRVDRIDPKPFSDGDKGKGTVSKEIRIIVAGYNVNSFAYLDMPAFLCAELLEDGTVIGRTEEIEAALERKGVFKARVYRERIQKIQRYSFQRAFAEAYDLRREITEKDGVDLARAEAGVFLERGVPDADFSTVIPKWITCRGAAHYSEIRPEQRRINRIINDPRDAFKCFRLDELETCTAWEGQGLNYTLSEPGRQDYSETVIAAGSFAVIDMGAEFTGMIGMELEAKGEATVYVLESEILTGNSPDGVDFTRLGDSDLVKWIFPAGRHSVLTFEPYSFRYAKIVVLGADILLKQFKIIRYSFREIDRKPPENMPEDLRLIYDAAVETFRQNAVDIYMDCPSRERAGWLCDSYFTSRTERCLTGESQVERNFLENFLLPDHFSHIPEGMLPMCYPSDHYDGVFIPSWAMWYVIELKEYFDRTGDRELIDFAKPRVYGLIRYFERFLNEFGLLEKLESWVFIEWSKANELAQDVNFPLNFLYSRVLSDAGELYGDEALKEQGAKLIKTASAMSFTGTFFCDNAVRRGGKLVLTGDCTECCQYYAFYLGAADESSHPELFNVLVNEFGPDRAERGAYPEIYPANAFIGNYLRLDWIMRIGLVDKVRDDIRGYFYTMAKSTGTLWEHQQSVASCNHGFASHVAVWLSEMKF